MPVTIIASGRTAPVRPSGRTDELLRRADAELLAAQFSPEPWERFTHAHLAALRAGAALLADRAAQPSRRAPRTVWELLDRSFPHLSRWTVYFAGGAGLRSAVEAGRFDAVSEERAEDVVCMAEDFLDVVRRELEPESDTPAAPSVRAG